MRCHASQKVIGLEYTHLLVCEKAHKAHKIFVCISFSFPKFSEDTKIEQIRNDYKEPCLKSIST